MNIPFLSWNKYVLGLRYRRLKLNSPIKLWHIIHVFSFLYERDECINTWNTSRFTNENELNKLNAKLIYCVLFTWKRNKQLSDYLLLLIPYFAFWDIRTIVVWFNGKKHLRSNAPVISSNHHRAFHDIPHGNIVIVYWYNYLQ
jgi:hypothetical protein